MDHLERLQKKIRDQEAEDVETIQRFCDLLKASADPKTRLAGAALSSITRDAAKLGIASPTWDDLGLPPTDPRVLGPDHLGASISGDFSMVAGAIRQNGFLNEEVH